MSMMVAAVGMQAAGVGMGVVSSYYGAKSQKSSLGFQAEMSEINAKLSESTAQSLLVQGQRQEQRTRLSTANLKSRQRVALAANGVALDEGSAAEILTTTDVMGEIDANTVHADAVRAAWGQRMQSTNYRNEAAMARSAASSINPGAQAFGTLIGGAAQVATSWYTGSKSGAFDKPSAISKADLAAANNTSDPLGSLMKQKGW